MGLHVESTVEEGWRCGGRIAVSLLAAAGVILVGMGVLDLAKMRPVAVYSPQFVGWSVENRIICRLPPRCEFPASHPIQRKPTPPDAAARPLGLAPSGREVADSLPVVFLKDSPEVDTPVIDFGSGEEFGAGGSFFGSAD